MKKLSIHASMKINDSIDIFAICSYSVLLMDYTYNKDLAYKYTMC